MEAGEEETEDLLPHMYEPVQLVDNVLCRSLALKRCVISL